MLKIFKNRQQKRIKLIKKSIFLSFLLSTNFYTPLIALHWGRWRADVTGYCKEDPSEYINVTSKRPYASKGKLIDQR